MCSKGMYSILGTTELQPKNLESFLNGTLYTFTYKSAKASRNGLNVRLCKTKNGLHIDSVTFKHNTLSNLTVKSQTRLENRFITHSVAH